MSRAVPVVAINRHQPDQIDHMTQTKARCWLLLVFTMLSLLSGVAWAESRPAFWKAESKDATVYLLGSMHFGRPDFYPLPAAVDRAFEQSSVLAVEVDVVNIDPKAALQALLKYGQMPAGRTLQSVLSEDVYRRLSEVCERKGLPLAAFEQLQPWFVALQLVESELRSSRLQQHLGVDLHFLKKVKAQRVDQLESFESQLKLFADSTMIQQETFLQQTLNDLAKSGAYLNTMAAAWQQGDVKALEQNLIEPFRDQEDSKELYRKMFTERNLAMTEHVQKYLGSQQTTFFVVGAGHMLGEDGIINLLKQRGYSVTRME